MEPSEKEQARKKIIGIRDKKKRLKKEKNDDKNNENLKNVEFV